MAAAGGVPALTLARAYGVHGAGAGSRTRAGRGLHLAGVEANPRRAVTPLVAAGGGVAAGPADLV